MPVLRTFKHLAIAGFLAVTATVSSAATLGLDLSNGIFTSLPGNYSLALPIDPHAIVDFQGNGSNGFGEFGGLTLNGFTSNTRMTYTYIGSEAGASNGATLTTGSNSFSNGGSVAGDSFTVAATFNDYVDLLFSTNNLGGFDTINNAQGSSTSNLLHIAFSDISNDPFATSVYAFFGDGAGDSDFDDMVVRIDVSEVPLPAGGFLLITALGGLAAARRNRRKS